MPRLDNSIRAYLLVYLLLLVTTIMPQLIYGQAELFLVINEWHNNFLDWFFYWFTFFGDGVFFIAVLVFISLFSYRKTLLGLVIFLSTAMVAQFLKRVIFDDRLRPFGVLGKEYDLYIPDGVTPLMHNSFPSGHTTTAFAMAAFLVLVLKNKFWWPVFLLLAVLAGYSRIYLTHHFPIDVWAGSVVGTLGAFISYIWLDQKFASKFGNRGLLSKK